MDNVITVDIEVWAADARAALGKAVDETAEFCNRLIADGAMSTEAAMRCRSMMQTRIEAAVDEAVERAKGVTR